MQHGIDSQEYDQGPIRNSKIWIATYFFVFVTLFSFFFINVFVGMIILTFQALAAAEFGGELDRNKVSFFNFLYYLDFFLIALYNMIVAQLNSAMGLKNIFNSI